MSAIGSGLRQLGAAIEGQQIAAREQEKIEIARQREERLAEKQKLEAERITSVNEALKNAASASDQVRLLFDMWRNVTIELDSLRNEVTRLRVEIDTLKGSTYNQYQGPHSQGVLGNEYFNQF